MNLLESYKIELALLENFIKEEEERRETEKVAKELADVFTKGNKVLICGNGGSNCDALHFTEEFTGRFRGDRKALPAIAISDSSHITCVGNDYGFDYIFSRGVEAYGRAGDPPCVIASSKKAVAELNWKPVYTDVKDIIRTAWEWNLRNK